MNTYIELEIMTSNTYGNYLIDNIIEFYPAEKLLLNRLTQQHVVLHSTATQCLLLLIQQHNEVVTQDQLLRFAWGEKHREVTHNAFYQCILNLRKSIIKLGVEKSIVTTIARKGLIINKHVTIENIVSSSYHDQIAKEINSNPTEIDVSLANQNLEQVSDKDKSKHKNFYLTVSLLLVTILILLFIWISRPDTGTIYGMPEYIPLDYPDKKCSYYLNSDYVNNHFTQESKVGRFINNNPTLCSGNKYIYITTYENLKSMSVLICNKKVGNASRNMCSSVYYLDNY